MVAHLVACGLAILAAWVASPPALGGAAEAAHRVVSLVPAVTEMLFAIGAGPLVVGVSSFDRHPPEVASRTRVGALLDPDVERILALRPDLVVVYDTQSDLQRQLDRARVSTFAYRHGRLADVMSTLRTLGDRVGRSTEAAQLASELERRLDAVRRRTAGLRHPRTLLVFGREPLALRNIYASGGVGFLHDMLGLAGATNVFADVPRESIQATTEAILARAPEAIVELHDGTAPGAAEVAREQATWNALPSVPAVRARRIVLLFGDEFVVPGPRVARAVEQLARALHPEAFGRGAP
jgi:iron complex transport system substrate-binding protein